MADQFGSYLVGSGESQRLHYYIRAEALAAVIRLMDCEDPIETYDRVMMVHKARQKDEG